MYTFSEKQLRDYKRIYGEDMSDKQASDRFTRSLELIASVVGNEEFDLGSLDLSRINDSLGFHETIENLPQKMIDPKMPTEEIIADAERKLDYSEKIRTYKEDIVGDPTRNYVSQEEFAELRQLRHRVIEIHVGIEGTLGLIIDYGIISETISCTDVSVFLALTNKIGILTDQLTFRERLLLAKKLNLIDSGLAKKIEEINSIRNKFAHEDAGEMVLFIRDRVKKKNLLRNLLETSKSLDAISYELSKPFDKKFG